MVLRRKRRLRKFLVKSVTTKGKMQLRWRLCAPTARSQTLSSDAASGIPSGLKKMFCSETCEALAHEDKKAAAVKKQAASKAAAAKKATKVKNWKNTDSGQFWWHDQ